jgi:hypothetical protein
VRRARADRSVRIAPETVALYDERFCRIQL